MSTLDGPLWDVWRGADGSEWSITGATEGLPRMEPRHARNCIRMIRRNAQETVAHMARSAWGYAMFKDSDSVAGELSERAGEEFDEIASDRRLSVAYRMSEARCRALRAVYIGDRYRRIYGREIDVSGGEGPFCDQWRHLH